MSIEDLAKKPKDFKTKGKYVIRTPTDQQRVKLEKLMENPEKPVPIPMSKQQKDLLAAVPTFVRNVMGSSAGAGSGEFHVYRHLRRKEFARQKQIQHKSKQEELDEQFQQKVEDNRNAAESKTAKKRAKRQKKKKQRQSRPTRPANGAARNDDGDDSASGDEDDDDAEEEADEEEQKQPAPNSGDEAADGPSAEKRRKSADEQDADDAGETISTDVQERPDVPATNTAPTTSDQSPNNE